MVRVEYVIFQVSLYHRIGESQNDQYPVLDRISVLGDDPPLGLAWNERASLTFNAPSVELVPAIRKTMNIHSYECEIAPLNMREVRLRYSAASIVNSSLKELLEIVDRITLKASLFQEGQGDWIRQVYDVVLKDGRAIEEISEVSFMEVESHFHSRRVNGHEVHTLMAKNHHELGRVGSVIVDAVVMPDSVISAQGATLLIRGAPTGVKSMVEGFKNWKEPSRISVVEHHQEPSDNIASKISEHQSKVFLAAYEAGYFENPRRISLVDLSIQLGLSRSTIAGHIRSVEIIMANSLISSLRNE